MQYVKALYFLSLLFRALFAMQCSTFTSKRRVVCCIIFLQALGALKMHYGPKTAIKARSLLANTYSIWAQTIIFDISITLEFSSIGGKVIVQSRSVLNGNVVLFLFGLLLGQLLGADLGTVDSLSVAIKVHLLVEVLCPATRDLSKGHSSRFASVCSAHPSHS